MTEDKLYLCVDPDGTEKASEYPPRRLYDELKLNATEKYVSEHPFEKYGENQWIDTCSDTDYGYFGRDYSFDGICLPKGMIRKLTGKDLTWEDEPFPYCVLTPEEEDKAELERLKLLKFDTLEEKCRYFQSNADFRLHKNSFILAHIDGRTFSRLVKNRFKKPFDSNFIEMMNETAKYLCQNIPCVKFAYVQSDEITLVMCDYSEENNDAEFFFDGRLCKLQSIIASMATSKFGRLMTLYSIRSAEKCADCAAVIEGTPLMQFDCKCWNVLNGNDAFAWVLYRQIDCVRNSKQQAAQTYFSHKELEGKHTDEQIELLKKEKGIDWYTDYNDGEKYGRFVYKRDFVLSRVNEDGSTDEFKRGKWVVEGVYDISNPENKKKLFEIVPEFKLDTYNITD